LKTTQFVLAALLGFFALSIPASAQNIQVDITPAHATNHFVPNQTLGAGVDRIAQEAIDKGLAQPAVKVRGREYLRIIYGPEYVLGDNLERLRRRGLGRKRSLAAREFALGIEALERFVQKEPLRRVHECVFGVLALESEPVDPRL